MKKNNSALLGGALLFIAIVILFSWPRLANPYRKTISMWKDLGVDCLPSHQNANLHIHPTLTIKVDGKKEIIPANIGIVQGCMAETHTHDADGVIHIESVEAGRTFTLAQFFKVWGKELERDGFRAQIFADGNSVTDPNTLIMRDLQVIEINYGSI